MSESRNGRPLRQCDIADALGLSRSAICKHVSNGMPVHSVEAAAAWYDAHIDPARAWASKVNPANH